VTEGQINIIKGRIGEAIVEAILREAGYQVCRTGRESSLPGLMQKASEFTPDFVVFRAKQPGLYRLFHLEVKFRFDVESFLRDEAKKGPDSIFEQRKKWPELHFVFVTDQPRRGKACIQIADLRNYQTGFEVQTIDLDRWDLLEIASDVLSSYQAAIRDLFSALHYQTQLARQLYKEQAVTVAPPPRARLGIA
jgi:hypothetical protein